MSDARLVCFLSDLAVSEVPFPSGNFSQRLGGLIDFKDSMQLAAFHAEFEDMAFEPGPKNTPAAKLKQEVLRGRLSLMRVVLEGFTPNGQSARLRLPTHCADVSPDQLMTFEPYHRFYAAHQREFESGLKTLQLRVREVLSQTSAGLQQLAAMDEMVRGLVVVQTRKSFAAIPRLLGKRLDDLLQEHRSSQGTLSEAWTQPDGWLEQFGREMQELLLAELELRLMPILGLVEAMEQEVIEK